MQFSNESLFDDNNGPEIKIYQNEIELLNQSTIYPPFNITISLDDDLPINISGLNYHDIRIWIDDNQNESVILNDLFIPTSSTSGYINYLINTDLLFSDLHTINIEAWDIMNNSSVLSYNLNIFNTGNENVIYNVYNFPNPFKNETFFTFSCSNNSPLNVNINIYSLNGEKVNSLSEYLEVSSNDFYKVHWNGLNYSSEKIQNGVYLYELEILEDNRSIHKNIYKLAKSK